MKTLLAAFAVAVLLAAVAAQLAATFFSGQPLAVFVLVAACCLLAAWVAVRSDRRATAARSSEQPEQSSHAPAHAPPSHSASNGKRETGSVKWFDRNRGYGFVIRANGDEIFVHQRSVRKTGGERSGLRDGQEVSFVAIERQRGWQAEDVEPAKP